MNEKLIPVESSNIKAIGYSNLDQILIVQFHSLDKVTDKPGTYWYFDVPLETFSEFANAESKGKFFHQEIKSQYKCLKVTNFEQDVVFDAVHLANQKAAGDPGRYLPLSELCELMDWELDIIWEKIGYRNQWFDLQDDKYRDKVFSLINTLSEYNPLEWPRIAEEIGIPDEIFQVETWEYTPGADYKEFLSMTREEEGDGDD